MKISKIIGQQNILLINKPQGQTPLQTIYKLKGQYPKYRSIKMGFAGRLDPMAEGLLLLLQGSENKKRKIYEELKKEYEFRVLFGVATDTYDLLGKITKISKNSIDEKKIKAEIKKFVGTRQQPYPPYSSKTVKGKPLYFYARQDKLNDIEIPAKKITIEKLNYLSHELILKQNLEKEILGKIEKVVGDFRQREILLEWKRFFEHTKHKTFLLANFNVSCTSGTYVRYIANELGKQLGTCSLAYSIKRTRIGEYKLEDALSLKSEGGA